MNTDPDIAELKECQRRLEAKLSSLIQRHPVLRRAEAKVNIQRQSQGYWLCAIKAAALSERPASRRAFTTTSPSRVLHFAGEPRK